MVGIRKLENGEKDDFHLARVHSELFRDFIISYNIKI